MNILLRRIALCFLCFGLARQMTAATLTYDVGASGFSLNSDSVANHIYNGTINVPDGGSLIGTLQLGDFIVASGPTAALTPFTLNETFIVNGVSSSITLSGSLLLAPSADTLTYLNGSPTVMFLPSGQSLTITPLPLDPIVRTVPGTSPYTLSALFQLSAVPDYGSTLTLLALSMLALAATAWWFKPVTTA